MTIEEGALLYSASLLCQGYIAGWSFITPFCTHIVIATDRTILFHTHVRTSTQHKSTDLQRRPFLAACPKGYPESVPEFTTDNSTSWSILHYSNFGPCLLLPRICTWLARVLGLIGFNFIPVQFWLPLNFLWDCSSLPQDMHGHVCAWMAVDPTLFRCKQDHTHTHTRTHTHQCPVLNVRLPVS